MDSRKLRKSSRQELLEMLLDATEENEQLRKENSELKQQLESRRLLCEQSGSLAEAALKLSGIFEAADEAVKIYQASLQPEPKPEPQPAGEQDGPSEQS
ncbi:hypothetical protein [uncultured Faecalibaculum sp.]|uniref:hypothetical protein n=1 Tax=uncultured Faecalibaculum sp. TaxID=1729681 RepID=UPI0025FD453F|nr:hypothetical protein [uncultured Faecalibaculum sp.]